MILILKHISIEGPGTIETYFKEAGYELNILELSDGEIIPEDLSNTEAIVILGGPMNVYEEEKHPFLSNENVFIQKALKEKIPMMGICLGAQLMAKACGAKVKKAAAKEHGWAMLEQTEDGVFDSLFENTSGRLIGFQWHEDTFDLPNSAVLLSTSSACPHQAFKVGENAYGLQYHIEVNQPIIESWIKKYFKVKHVEESKEGAKMIQQYQQLKKQFHSQADQIYRNFEGIINRVKVRKAKV